MAGEQQSTREILDRADAWQQHFGTGVHDRITASTFAAAEGIAARAVERRRPRHRSLTQSLDRLLTSRAAGIPMMVLMLAVVFWIRKRPTPKSTAWSTFLGKKC